MTDLLILADRVEGLLPCPFCGGAAQLSGTLSHAPMNTVRCTSCSAHCGLGLGDAAIDAWNTRSPDLRTIAANQEPSA